MRRPCFTPAHLRTAVTLAFASGGWAHGSGHYVVDDADLIDARSCEAEVFGNDRNGSRPMAQLDPRIGLVADQLYLDLTWTRELGGDREEAWTVGVNFVALRL